MSRKFVLDREAAFIDAINRELHQDVVGQTVLYYAVSSRDTQRNVYGEAIKKVTFAPVSVACRVERTNERTKSLLTGQDSEYTLKVRIHRQELIDRNLVPRDGDFVEFGSQFFEIAGTAHPQMLAGQANYLVETVLTCVPARGGQFANGGTPASGDDHVHPVQPPVAVDK